MNALPWRGQFTPDFVEALLSAYRPHGIVLDPFCGSGTVLMEAARLGWPAYGVEVNPSAYMLTNLYSLSYHTTRERGALIRGLRARMANEVSIYTDARSLGRWVASQRGEDGIVMNAVFLLALGNKPNTDATRLARAFTQVDDLLNSLPDQGPTVHVELGDARSVDLPRGSVDTLLTSPPYVNVFNYHQNYRVATELLGWEVLPAARAEFGSNRKHRQNRFLTVIQYAQDIGLALLESQRLVRPGGTSIWVVGRESSVRGEPIPNPLIVFNMAKRGCGLALVAKHERKFRSRYGPLVYEDILVFHHTGDEPQPTESDIAALGRQVGVDVLAGLSKESDVRDEVCAAMDDAERVSPSATPEHRQKEVPVVRTSTGNGEQIIGLEWNSRLEVPA